MKKLFYLLLFLPLGLFGQTQIVNVGTAANSGDGDPLRTAFQKVNLNTVAIQDSFNTYRTLYGDIYTKSETRTVIHDSLDALRDSALLASDYFWLKTDTVSGQVQQVVTQTQLANFEGAGSISMYELKGIINVTDGIPDNTDSLIINTAFVTHPHLLIYRDGVLQWFNSGLTNNTGTITDAYVFNQTTGTVIVRPAFATGEKLIVHAFDPIVWNTLTPEGGAGAGGGSGASTLLTSLRAFWQLDEISGTAVNDALGTYNGTTTGAVNQTGKFGKAETFTRASNQYAQFGTTVGDVGTSDFSIACWIYQGSLPSAYQGIMGNYGSGAHYMIEMLNDNYILGVINFGGANIDVSSDAAVTAGSWIHICMTVDRSGDATLYLNGVAQAATPDVSAGVAVSVNNNNQFSIGQLGNFESGWSFNGSIDDPGIWLKVLTQGEIDELILNTYPW